MPHQDESRREDGAPNGDPRPSAQLSKSQSQQSLFAKSAMMKSSNLRNAVYADGSARPAYNVSLAPLPRSYPVQPKATDGVDERQTARPMPEQRQSQNGAAMNDTPTTTAPSSPNIQPL